MQPTSFIGTSSLQTFLLMGMALQLKFAILVWPELSNNYKPQSKKNSQVMMINKKISWWKMPEKLNNSF